MLLFVLLKGDSPTAIQDGSQRPSWNNVIHSSALVLGSPLLLLMLSALLHRISPCLYIALGLRILQYMALQSYIR